MKLPKKDKQFSRRDFFKITGAAGAGVHEASTKAQAEEVAKALAQTLGEVLGAK